MTPELISRLDNLKDAKIIAGYQRGGGHNHGRGKAPLPWLIFPASYGPASSYYNQHDLSVAVAALERFGPLELDLPGAL